MADESPSLTPAAQTQAEAARRKRFRIFGGVLAICLFGGGLSWLINHNHQTTDDAYIEADVVQLAPQIGGIVATVGFGDNQAVTKGQLLLQIDPRDAEVQVSAARASLAVAEAQEAAATADLELTKATTGAAIDEAHNVVEQLRRQVAEARQQAEAAAADAERASTDVKRYQDLFNSKVASGQRVEQAIADARATRARWKAALTAVTALESQQAQTEARLHDALAAPQRMRQKEAQLANARAQKQLADSNLQAALLALSYTTVNAPQSGRMAKRGVNPGDVVQKGQVLAQLVVDSPWVIANFKETQLDRMGPGQPVSIQVDALPGQRFSGKIDSIQAGSGSRFALLPAENATGNFVKVVQRVPVKITFDALDPVMQKRLAPGMSVVPDVDVSAPVSATAR
ncbi:MAG TPA: HlyD family secretion protein [Rhodospirillaceae bacterium]|nr:HlyD family secretion protein [Rhodospirillaceae bacterium]